MKKWKNFEVLRDKNFFNQVTVDGKEYGVSWNTAIDLSCEELYENGIMVEK